MTPFYFGEILYCIVAACFLIESLIEEWRLKGVFDLSRLAGLVLCLFWPLLVIWLIVEAVLRAIAKRALSR